jgi:broad specificity phosphatase PhoE
MTTICLVRHGEADEVGVRLQARRPAVHLTRKGRAQARSLGLQLRNCDVTSIFTSPLERASETADEIGAQVDVAPIVLPGINEVEFGEWTGRLFAELNSLQEWRLFNSARADASPPGGESMRQVQSRAIEALWPAVNPKGRGTVVAVTHADVIRAVLAWWLPMSLDEIWRIEIGLASVTGIELAGQWPRVILVNGLSGERDLGLASSPKASSNLPARG